MRGTMVALKRIIALAILGYTGGLAAFFFAQRPLLFHVPTRGRKHLSRSPMTQAICGVPKSGHDDLDQYGAIEMARRFIAGPEG